MIGPLVLPLPLTLPLLLTVALVASSATSVSQNSSRCDILQYVKDNSSEVAERWVTVEGVRRAVVFEWSSRAERAAAALLASALRLAGFRSTRLRRAAPALPLFNRSYDITNVHSEAVVLLAARWTPGDVWSNWLQAVGVSVVPVAPRLHRRITHTPHTHTCTATAHDLNKFYVASEWERFINRTQFNGSIFVSRRELLQRIRSNDSETFTFLDVEVWSDEPGVEVIAGAGVPITNVSSRALSAVDGALWRYSPALWHLLSRFEPRLSDLRRLLTLDALDSPDSLDWPEYPMVAVCQWAATSTRLLERLRTWARKIYTLRYVHYAFVFLCTGGSENDTIHEYSDLLNRLQEELNNNGVYGKNNPKENRCVELEPIVANCDDDRMVTKTITDMLHTEKFYRTIGIIGPGRIFGNVTDWAESNKLTLVSYSTVGGKTVGAAGGRAGTAARALRDLLAACRWTRLAVLSDREHAATELSAALRPANDLNLKFVPLTSNRAAIRDVLLSLKYSDARVFLVNAGAQLASEVMRVAAELGLTERAGRVWLAREWDGAGAGAGAGAGEAPYELTFAWRGGAIGADGACGADCAARSTLRRDLQARWSRRGSWPLYAAPLADAVLALGEGYKDLFRVHPNFYDDVHSNDTFRTYWNHMETEVNISRGVVQELRFKDREFRSPRVFLYRWNGTRAALITEWRVGVGTGPTCPLALSDGSESCTVPVGDRFDQRCGEKWLIAGILALIALVPLLLMAALAARRALLARDAHLIKRAEEMLEARWRAKASRLEPYFVERRALQLCEEVGAGRFGRVWLGFLRGPGARSAAEAGAVAAKALREDAAPVEETEFFREARALAALQHENVVRFVGVCVTDGPPLLLMEYAFFGDLLRYLRARRHLVTSDSPEAAQVSAEALTRFARQAATALAYLARRGFVHRDVRAANCLVDERRNLKLADFGMARATRPADGAGAGDANGDGEYTSRRRALFPVLWMAPESLSRGVFSAASDVWALGVLALELVTLGARPYGALSPLQVHHCVVAEGRRPPLPRELGAEARGALLACWRREARARPAAAALAAWLAARPRALAPVPRPLADDRAEDVDSGIGSAPSPAPASIDDILLYDDVASFS